MNRVRQALVWLSRIHRCKGFGIQSPSDYWFVCNVINEHYPYYKYEQLGRTDDWLTRKLGLLYFRLANWRQPATAYCQTHHDYFSSGASRLKLMDNLDEPGLADLIQIVAVDSDNGQLLPRVLNSAKPDTLLIVEGIWRNWALWEEIVAHERSRVTFDLYYCGLVFFDQKRSKQNYKINF